jgi:hypothetical protein
MTYSWPPPCGAYVPDSRTSRVLGPPATMVKDSGLDPSRNGPVMLPVTAASSSNQEQCQHQHTGC